MSLTFYLPSSGAPANSPAFETGYTDSSQADRIAATSTRGATALSSKSVNVSASGSNVYYLVRQYVLPQIKAHDFTTSETFDLALRCLESAAGLDATLCLCIKIMSADCSTDRGSLIDSRINTTEFGTSLQSRYCQTKAFTANRSAQAGDRLVLEFYARCDSPDAGSISMDFGEDASTALSLSNTDTDADHPYITINAAIELYATGYSGSSSLSGGGACEATGKKGGRGSSTISAVCALAALGVAAMSGLSSVTGAGGISALGTKAASGPSLVSGYGAIESTGTAEEAINYSGASAVSGAGAIVSSGAKGGAGLSEISGWAGLEASGSKAGQGVSAPTGAGEFSASGTKATSGVSTVSGYGGLDATGQAAPSHSGASVVTGWGVLESYGVAGEWHTDALTPSPAMRVIETDGQKRTVHPKPASRTVEISGRPRTVHPRSAPRTVTQARRRTWN